MVHAIGIQHSPRSPNSPAEDGGALREWWGDITLQFATTEVPDPSRLAVSRTRLRARVGERLSLLDLSAQPAWVKDLRSIWYAAKEVNEGAARTQVMEEKDDEEQEEEENKEGEGESASPMWLTELLERHKPKSFEEVLGQDELASTLAKRVTTKDYSGHIVLHGPEGSGKLTLARLYGQALQCEEPTQTGSPCQSCEPCKAFRPIGGGFGYLEIDAKKQGKIEHARYLLKCVSGVKIADRSAIVVTKADRLDDTAADILLKTLEERSGTTTFIFVLHQVPALQPALRSRTQAFRLLPLADEVALNRLATVCNMRIVFG
jgi:hypothetical protein